MLDDCFVVAARPQRQNLPSLLVTNTGETPKIGETTRKLPHTSICVNHMCQSCLYSSKDVFKKLQIYNYTVIHSRARAVKSIQAIPVSFFKLDEGLLSLIRLEVNTGLEPIHFKSLVDTSFSIQI